MASAGLSKRWKEHEQAAKKKSDRRFYQSYPDNDVPFVSCFKKGTFQQLNQRVALAVNKSNMTPFVDLFDWTVSESNQLAKLSVKGMTNPSLQYKKYRHLCYLFELTYAVALAPQANITQNPTCEWQLGWFGK